MDSPEDLCAFSTSVEIMQNSKQQQKSSITSISQGPTNLSTSLCLNPTLNPTHVSFPGIPSSVSWATSPSLSSSSAACSSSARAVRLVAAFRASATRVKPSALGGRRSVHRHWGRSGGPSYLQATGLSHLMGFMVLFPVSPLQSLHFRAGVVRAGWDA